MVKISEIAEKATGGTRGKVLVDQETLKGIRKQIDKIGTPDKSYEKVIYFDAVKFNEAIGSTLTEMESWENGDEKQAINSFAQRVNNNTPDDLQVGKVMNKRKLYFAKV